MGESFLSARKIGKRPKRLKHNASRRGVRDEVKENGCQIV